MCFKIDTGADVTVIPESVFKRIKDANLMHSDRILCGPAQIALHVIGQFTATLKHRGVVISEGVYVVRGLQTPLIGLPAIKALGLVVECVLLNRRIIPQKYSIVILSCLLALVHWVKSTQYV